MSPSRTGLLTVALGVLLLGVAGCSGASAAEQQAQRCFQHLSMGQMDQAMECVAPDRRDRIRRGMEQRAQQMKGCHEQVKEARTRREDGERAEVRLTFKQPCGEPPADASGRQVTGIGVGLVKSDGKLWIVEFERLMD